MTAGIESLVGKTIESAWRTDDDIYLVLIDGSILRLEAMPWSLGLVGHSWDATVRIESASRTGLLVCATVTSACSRGARYMRLATHARKIDAYEHHVYTDMGACKLITSSQHSGPSGSYAAALFVSDVTAIPEGAKILEDF